MVSWNKSFGAAFKVILYSVIWWIVGVFIIFIGFGLIGNQMMNFTGALVTGRAPDFSSVLIGFIVMAFGYIIAIGGSLASFMKVFTELIVEETDESRNNNISSTKSNQYDEELKSFEEDIEIKSDYADKWYNKGVALADRGNYDKALQAYKKALEIKPNYDDAWFNRACIYSVKGEKEMALFDLKKAIGIDKSNKEEAKKEHDFENLWNDEDFKKLVE